jgi:hypothetical protein
MDIPPNKPLFLIKRTGDPFSRFGWDIHEYKESYDEQYCIFRGDLSPSQGRDRTVFMLRSMYPGCKVRIER